MAENNLADLMKFFDVGGTEFRAFWVTLTDAEKAEFKAAELSQD